MRPIITISKTVKSNSTVDSWATTATRRATSLGRMARRSAPSRSTWPAGWSVDPVDGLEDGGLAASVGAEQTHEAAIGHGDVDPVDDAPPADVDGEADQVEAHADVP